MSWFLLGALLMTTGLGEERGPAYLIGVQEQARYVCSQAQIDTSNKYTYAGWVASGWGEWCSPWGGVGLAYTRRDGGPWVKHTAFLHLRARLGQVDLTYHREIWQDSPTNAVQMLELRTGRGLIDSSLALYHHTVGWGTRWQVGVALGRD